MTTTLKFFYNGIKASDGKLQRAHYSMSKLLNYPVDTITIYGRNYAYFTSEIRAAFTVRNDSESNSDYWENDCIRVTPDHPHYNDVLVAVRKAEERIIKQSAAYTARMTIKSDRRYAQANPEAPMDKIRRFLESEGIKETT